ncbi:MAG: hypothetical protein ACOYIG_08305, partial [Acetivibrionales bacterium]
PTLTYSNLTDSSWTEVKSDMIHKVANDHGLTFVDLLYDVNIGVDFTIDTYDAGVHMNIRGAEKVTAYLGSYLLENHDLRQQNNTQYDEMLQEYRKVRKIAMLQSEKDFYEFIKLLAANSDKWTVFISAYDEYTEALDESDYTFLRDKLGLNLIANGGFADSYVAVIKNGEVEYEAVSGRRIEYNTWVNGQPVYICSSGWYSIPHSAIKIDGTEYSPTSYGLNFVVYDNEAGLPIASMAFNTRYKEKPLKQGGWTYRMLRNYESKICFERGGI